MTANAKEVFYTKFDKQTPVRLETDARQIKISNLRPTCGFTINGNYNILETGESRIGCKIICVKSGRGFSGMVMYKICQCDEIIYAKVTFYHN
jgi:hypothetical protein